MEKRLEQLRGGVAAVASMTGIGWPRIAFAPPGEGGTGDDTGDDDGGDDAAGGDGEDGKGADDGGKGQQSRLANAGLLNRRKAADDKAGDDKTGDDTKQKEPAKDGRPDGLADKFWNAKDKTVNVDALIKSQRDLETEFGKLKRSKTIGGELPETPDGYFADGIKLPDTVTNIPLPPDDPGLKAWGEVAHKFGIGKDAAVGIVTEYLTKMNEFVDPPIDPDAEMAKLGKGGEALLDGIFTWAEGREKAGDFSEDDVSVIVSLSETAAGIRFLAKMRENAGEMPIPIDPGTGQRGLSFDQWRDKYKDAVDKQDYKEQERLDELFRTMWPGRQFDLNGGYSSEKRR